VPATLPAVVIVASLLSAIAAAALIWEFMIEPAAMTLPSIDDPKRETLAESRASSSVPAVRMDAFKLECARRSACR